MTDTKDMRRSCLTIGDINWAQAHIDAQDAKIKALVEALEISRALTIEATEVGFEYRDYDWPERMFVHNGVITAALAAAKEKCHG